MIPGSPAVKNQPDWQKQYADAVREPAELLRLLGLSPRQMPPPTPRGGFGLRVPHAFIGRMRRGDPADPLLRQVWPDAAETRPTPGYLADPLREQASTPVPGLIHKYASRVLLVASASCAVHCRYCFRRHFPYSDHLRHPRHLGRVVDYLRARPQVEELVLSGGDPLALDDTRLAELARQIERVPHLRTLRLHTRLPVVLPARVDPGLLDWIGRLRLRPVMVLHTNHPNEVDAAFEAGCRKLVDAGVTLLNQSVLLAGINDDDRVLAELSRRLFDCRVLPYYLHLLDPVEGSAAFRVAPERVRMVYSRLETRLSGYLLPRLVRELPGAAHKVQLGSPSFRDGILEIESNA